MGLDRLSLRAMAALNCLGVWDAELNEASPWLPGRKWTGRSSVFLQVHAVLPQGVVGYVVEPDFPHQLGSDSRVRVPRVTDTRIFMTNVRHHLQAGCIYAAVGTSQPAWRFGQWVFDAPRGDRKATVLHVLGWGHFMPKGAPEPLATDSRAPLASGLQVLAVDSEVQGFEGLSLVEGLCSPPSPFGLLGCRPLPDSPTAGFRGLGSRLEACFRSMCNCKSMLLPECVAIKPRQLPAEPLCSSLQLTGFVDLNGALHTCPSPERAQTVQDWLSQYIELPWEHVWATCDGKSVPLMSMMQVAMPVLFRLRLRVRGGAASKHKGFAGGDVDKLRKHLLSKGVPDTSLDARVDAVLEAITPAQLSDVYQGLDPWSALKAIVHQKVRLVTSDELKYHKGHRNGKKHEPSASTDGVPDPWSLSDPWSEGRADMSCSENQIELLPEFFVNEDLSCPHVLSEVVSGCTGICLMSAEQVEVLTTVGANLSVSADECAVVVPGTSSPSVGSFDCEAITFLAKHKQIGKVLLRGFLVNLGERRISVKDTDEIMISPKDSTVVTFEIAEHVCKDWPLAKLNPLKYAFKTVEGLQTSVLNTWSRKYFNGKLACGRDEAKSWHSFARVLTKDLERLLKASGRGGLFITPKGKQGTGPSGEFRVVWGDGFDLERALVVANANSGIWGIVRGRNCLGWRVPVADYAAMRSVLEPGWLCNDHLRYDVPVHCRFVASPMPENFDRESVQKVLNSFGWEAMPIRQLSAKAWLLGASAAPPRETLLVQGSVVLLREEVLKQKPARDSAVVSAPSNSRRALDEHLRTISVRSSPLPAQPLALPIPARMAPGPQQSQVDALRHEFEEKLQDLTNQMQHTFSRVELDLAQNKEVQASTQSQLRELQTEAQEQHARVERVETSISSMAASMCTRDDLSQVLKEALAQQSQDLRALFAKRSPEPSPANAPAKAAKLGC